MDVDCSSLGELVPALTQEVAMASTMALARAQTHLQWVDEPPYLIWQARAVVPACQAEPLRVRAKVKLIKLCVSADVVKSG